MKLLWFAILCLLFALASGCASKGYRHCIGYMGATYCVDKPHTHDSTGKPR